MDNRLIKNIFLTFLESFAGLGVVANNLVFGSAANLASRLMNRSAPKWTMTTIRMRSGYVR